MAKLEFFWDVASPYSYLASTQIEALRKRTGGEVLLRPFLLGAVFKASENTSPALVPAKAMYMREDLRRWRDHYGIPMRLPPDEVPFPPNSLLAMRCAVAADRLGAGERFCHAIFHAMWAEGRDVALASEIKAVADALSLDGEALLGSASMQSTKDVLRANTDEAVSRGAFGAPSLFVGDELFVGNDRLAFAEAALCKAMK